MTDQTWTVLWRYTVPLLEKTRHPCLQCCGWPRIDQRHWPMDAGHRAGPATLIHRQHLKLTSCVLRACFPPCRASLLFHHATVGGLCRFVVEPRTPFHRLGPATRWVDRSVRMSVSTSHSRRTRAGRGGIGPSCPLAQLAQLGCSVSPVTGGPAVTSVPALVTTICGLPTSPCLDELCCGPEGPSSESWPSLRSLAGFNVAHSSVYVPVPGSVILSVGSSGEPCRHCKH